MRDQEIVGLWEAYASMYTQTEQTVEEEVVDEDLQQKVGQALDAAAKNPVIQAIGSAIAPVRKGRGTVTQADQQKRIQQNVAKEEVGQLDGDILEGSYEDRIAANNKKYDAARKRAAQRAQARNEARARGENVGSPRPERTTYRDSAGVERHHSGARMPKKEDQKESFDLFDYLLEYLVAEGYADNNKAALAIMANMSEEWKQSIVEGEGGEEESKKPFTGEGPKKPKGWKPTGPKLKTGQRPGYAR